MDDSHNWRWYLYFMLGVADQLHSWLGLAAMVTLLALAGRTFLSYRFSKVYNLSTLLSFLYEKSLDQNKGALLYLLDQLKTQELKECAILYFYLWRGGPQTINELAQACEIFFQEIQEDEVRQVNIRFAVKDVLAKLLQWGIALEVHPQEEHPVGETGEEELAGHYGALAPDKATTKLEQHWDSLFQDSSLLSPPPSSSAIPRSATIQPSTAATHH